MILHLGKDFFVKTKDILMILDHKEAVTNKDTGFFLKNFYKIPVSKDEKPKSVVITTEEGINKLYLSPISSRTLLKRSREREIAYMSFGERK